MKYTFLPVQGKLVLNIESYHQNKHVSYIGQTWNPETKQFDASSEPVVLNVSQKYKSHYVQLVNDNDLTLISSEQ